MLLLQIANIRYTSKAEFAGSALHILHRSPKCVYCIATAQQTGLKLLLKSYDLGDALLPCLVLATAPA